MRRALDPVVAALGRFPGETVDLLVGEPCFDPPDEIRAAFERIAGEPASGYGPPAGLPELREILARRAGGAVAAGDVVVTHGAKGGLLAVLAALVEPGDEIVHPLPCYPAYPAMVRRLGGVPVGVPEHGDGFAGWSDAVLAAAGPRTAAVVVSSPSNPSGTTMTGDVLAALVDGCRERGLRLVLDQAYDEFRFDDRGALDPAVLDPEVVVRVGSASKSLALCGWRMGWVVAEAGLAARVTGVQAALLNPPSTPPQRALLALPEVPASYFETNRGAVRERIGVVVGALSNAGFDAAMPAGGFYVWVDIRDRLSGSTSAAWCERLAGERGVGLWPGEDYGSPGWVRLALPRGDRWRETVAELEHRLSR